MGKSFRKDHVKTKKNWLVATNQIWKLYVALLGFIATLICFVVGVFSLATGTNFYGFLVVCGMILGVATFSWLLSVLRCPSCQTKLVWVMVSTRPHTSWLVDLTNLDSCPACHFLLSCPSTLLQSIR